MSVQQFSSSDTPKVKIGIFFSKIVAECCPLTSHKRKKKVKFFFHGAVSSKSRCVIALSFRMRERTLRKGSVGMITCLDDNRKNYTY